LQDPALAAMAGGAANLAANFPIVQRQFMPLPVRLQAPDRDVDNSTLHTICAPTRCGLMHHEPAWLMSTRVMAPNRPETVNGIPCINRFIAWHAHCYKTVEVH
jgi:hypothetical protein